MSTITSDIQSRPNIRFRQVGRPLTRTDAPGKVAGRTPYAGDYVMPNMLHMRVVRADIASARLVRLDVSKARVLDGVACVLTAEDIERSGIQRAEDFVYMTPGVSIVDTAEVGDTQVSIGGINGGRDAENSYALIVDGVLMTNPAALNREYADLGQIEILKGPQGALYGRNAAAGAIIITTDKPDGETGGYLKVSGAGDSTWLYSGAVEGSLAEGMNFRLQGDYRSTDGFYENSYLNRDNIVDDYRGHNINARVIWDAAEDTRWDFKFRRGEVSAASITFNAAFHLPLFEQLFGVPQFFEDVNDHEFVFQSNIDPGNEQESTEFSARVDHALSWADLSAWFLFSKINNNLSADGTSGAFGFFNGNQHCLDSTAAAFNAGVRLPAPTYLGPDPNFPVSLLGPYTPIACDGTQYQERKQTDYSFEARLNSRGSGPLSWLAGAYFLDIDREVGVNTGLDLGNGITTELYVPQGGNNPTEQLVHDRFSNRVLAAFGEVSYEITETTEVSLALRFDSERREVENLVPVNALSQYIDCDGPPYTGNAPINPGLCPGVNPEGRIAPKERTFSQLQPKLSLTWDVTDDWTLFGSAGVGFKSGGFNNQGAKATVDIFINGLINNVFLADLGAPPQAPVGITDDVDKETSVSLEAGIKGSLMDNRLRLEATAFNVQVDDMQFFEFMVGPFGLLRLNGNVDEVSLRGAEVGASWAVTDLLDVYAGWGYVDSEIEANSVRPDTVGNKSPYTPDWTASAGARVVMPLTGAWQFAASADVSAVGKTWFHVVQDQQRATLFNGVSSDFTPTRRDSYTVLNVRAGIENNRLSAVVFARNATEEVYLEEVIPAPEFGGTFIHPADLRRVGAELTVRF